MYAYFRGPVGELAPDRAVIEAGGVGYELFISGKTYEKLREGEEALLYAHLHLADGVQALYGFYSTEERDMFRKLISVTRVGPKLALSVLSKLAPSEIATAVVTEAAPAFDAVPGMGRKTSQRVILELKEQMKGLAFSAPAASNQKEGGRPAPGNMQAEAVAALTGLGYDGLTASKAVVAVTDAASVEELITKALRKLAR